MTRTLSPIKFDSSQLVSARADAAEAKTTAQTSLSAAQSAQVAAGAASAAASSAQSTATAAQTMANQNAARLTQLERARLVRQTLPPLAVGVTEVPVSWPSLAAGTFVVTLTLEAPSTSLGKLSYAIKPWSITATGCSVYVQSLMPLSGVVLHVRAASV